MIQLDEMLTPQFSLVLPAFNAKGTLARAVQSVLAQSYTDWQLVIVDDGSTDGTGEVARTFAAQDPRIEVVSQANTGCAGARRAGALRARGVFVTKLDADDELTPDALEVLAAAMDAHPDFDIYSATGYKVMPDGSLREALNDPRYLKPLSLTLEDLIDDCWIFGGAASIRRSTLERIGGFRAQMRCEDYDLWLRALARGATHYYVPAHLYRYHMGVAGRMNEDPTPSYRSYLVILEDLIGRESLTSAQVELARTSMTKFRERIRQIDETGTTDAEFTDAQARRFKSLMVRMFGQRGGATAILLVNRVKWIVRPLRVAVARRARMRARRP